LDFDDICDTAIRPSERKAVKNMAKEYQISLPPAAAKLRHELSLEAVRIILGHEIVTITKVCDEWDKQEAVNTIMKVG
jgi:hypothetical protein